MPSQSTAMYSAISWHPIKSWTCCSGQNNLCHLYCFTSMMTLHVYMIIATRQKGNPNPGIEAEIEKMCKSYLW